MIKLVATDLDNTLLDLSGNIPEETKTVIRQAEERGVIFTVATGRSYGSAKAVAKEMGASPMVICYNGSEIRNADDDHVLFQARLDEDVVGDIVGYCRENDLYLQMYAEKTIIVEKVRMDIHPDPDFQYVPYIEVGDFWDLERFDTPKLLIGTTPERVPGIQAELERLFSHKAFFARSADYLIEIMPKEVNKGASLERLCAYLGIKKEETMALGDNTNDMDLLRAAGLKVCVGNGVQSLKAIADYVCEKDRSEGFSEAISRFVLL